MNKCHDQHKCQHVTDPLKFQKHFNDISDKKKSKYFKPYKRHQFTKPKGKTPDQIKLLEEEHARKENYQEDLHGQVADMLKVLREKKALLTTEHKQTTDQVHKTLVEKAEERKKAKDEKFQVLKEGLQSE
jgi:hypothetical protein